MVGKMMFHPISASLLFVSGIWMGSMVHPLFGLVTIFGGMLLGFSGFIEDREKMNKKAKVVFYSFFIFLLSILSSGYIIIAELYL